MLIRTIWFSTVAFDVARKCKSGGVGVHTTLDLRSAAACVKHINKKEYIKFLEILLKISSFFRSTINISLVFSVSKSLHFMKSSHETIEMKETQVIIKSFSLEHSRF